MIVLPFNDNHSNFSIGILIKEAALDKDLLIQNYINPLLKFGFNESDFVAIGTHYNDNNKIPAKDGKIFSGKILKVCKSLQLSTLLVADTNYFKFLTKLTKTTNKIGAVLPCKWDNYEDINILLSTNYQATFYNDKARFTLNESLRALANFIHANQTEIGTNIIETAVYPQTITEIKDALFNLNHYGALTCDIETFGLRFNECSIATIAFAMDQHSGIAFDITHTRKNNTQHLFHMLRDFFRNFQGELIFHNALFDVKVLVYNLFMKHPKDYKGMEEGLHTFRNVHCTQVLTYIATNSTGGNQLDLKSNALEFAGDYAKDDIKDVTKIALPDLLEYNLIDAMATWYVLFKYDDCLLDEELREFYRIIAQPSLIPTIKMMLIGLPMDMKEINKLKLKLKSISNHAKQLLKTDTLVIDATKIINQIACEAANKKLKKLVKTVDQFNVEFNPGSDNHVRILLHDVMELPIVETTKTKLPSTKARVLENHKNRTTNPQHQIIFNSLLDLSSVEIILNNFIKNFEELAFYKEPNEPWLNGNLKTTGTQALRYSSSDPNMQNMPVNSTWGSDIKECFKAPEGWVIGGADFSSLEDRINTILTKDPNKNKVYKDGFDGHCLRAFAYFKEDMPDIINTVDSINSIRKYYPKLRQRSKAPTFALTYEGTWHTLVKNLGLSKSDAIRIEKQYHDLYKVSDEFSKKNIESAAELGYVTLAFGAKLRTPVLRQTLLNRRVTPYEAESEGRSANNAITQSWGVLTNRAVIEFENRLKKLKNGDIRYNVLICNIIHDAIYVLIKKDPKTIKWVNDNLVECMEWNDHPKIKSKDVPMKAELEIGSNLRDQTTIPNKASLAEIERILSGIAE